MYLSLLKLNPRSKKAMTEVNRPYEMHRSLMRAFPDRKDGGTGRVLFRLDTDNKTGDISILVQSEKKPDWAALDNSNNFFLEQPKCKIFEPTFSASQTLYFRLRANPTIKHKEKRLGILKEEEQTAWLQRKAIERGFTIQSLTIIPEGMFQDKMTDQTGARHSLSLLSVRFEGVLSVTDPYKFRQALEHGIGSAKGLGFGFLSIAPLKEG